MDWILITCIVGLSIPGILVVVPQTLNRIQEAASDRIGPGRDLPSTSRLAAVSIIQAVILVGIAAIVGGYTAPIVGFEAPVLEAVIERRGIWSTIRPRILPTAATSVGGSVLLLVAYYGVFRPRLDNGTVTVMEELRMDIGIAGRVLYGGIVEEVLTRWGLMSFLAWAGVQIVGDPTSAVIWSAIVLAGFIFGIGHLPSYLSAGCRFTRLFFVFMIVLNLGASLIFGWLFWQYGLVAAMTSHALFHVFWWPLDQIFAHDIAS